jgi:hypothetical protein
MTIVAGGFGLSVFLLAAASPEPRRVLVRAKRSKR